MNYGYFGNTYDIVKHSLLRWLAPCGAWSVHPMFTDDDPAHYVADYCCLLGAPAVSTETFRQADNRDAWIAAGNACQGHLFLDPDTGLRLNRPTRRLEKYLMINELVTIVEARPDELTLVFDQSIDSSRDAAEQIKAKLLGLKGEGIHGLAYHSHANFILVSKDPNTLANAKSVLLKSSSLPEYRLIEVTKQPA